MFFLALMKGVILAPQNMLAAFWIVPLTFNAEKNGSGPRSSGVALQF